MFQGTWRDAQNPDCSGVGVGIPPDTQINLEPVPLWLLHCDPRTSDANPSLSTHCVLRQRGRHHVTVGQAVPLSAVAQIENYSETEKTFHLMSVIYILNVE